MSDEKELLEPIEQESSSDKLANEKNEQIRYYRTVMCNNMKDFAEKATQNELEDIRNREKFDIEAESLEFFNDSENNSIEEDFEILGIEY